MRLYEAEKAVKIKEKEILRLEREIKDQRTINEVLLEKQRKQMKYDDSKHLAKQV